MTFEDIIDKLDKKIYYPFYFLFGEEPFYIDEIVDYIEKKVLTETEKEFNQAVIYGNDVDVKQVIDYCRRYPMMSNYQVVIVKEAQELEKIEELQPYLEKPLNSTILVIAYKYKKIDRRKSFAKVIEKHGVLFESQKVYDSKIPEWITQYLKKAGYSVTLKATMLLTEFLGNDLSKIRNELEKLRINLPTGTTINEEHIEYYIGISKEFNIFELHNALGKRDIVKSNQIINYFADNSKQHPLVVTITMLYNFFLKLLIYHQLTDKSRNNAASALDVSPYFIKDYEVAARHYSFDKLVQIIEILRDYDLRSKGVNNQSVNEGELLKEMVYKILH